MIILILFVALVAAVLAWSAYTKRAMHYLERSDAVWDRLYLAARQAVDDPNMPREIVAFAVSAALCSGCGCLTAQILRDRLPGRRRPQPSRKVAETLRHLTPAQRAVFNRLVTTAIFYDTMRAPLMGVIVRRLVFPWLSSVVNGDALPPAKHGVIEIMQSTKRAIEAQPERKRVLELHT